MKIPPFSVEDFEDITYWQGYTTEDGYSDEYETEVDGWALQLIVERVNKKLRELGVLDETT